MIRIRQDNGVDGIHQIVEQKDGENWCELFRVYSDWDNFYLTDERGTEQKLNPERLPQFHIEHIQGFGGIKGKS